MTTKQPYTKPTIVRMGSLVEKTEGSFSGQLAEPFSYYRIRDNGS